MSKMSIRGMRCVFGVETVVFYSSWSSNKITNPSFMKLPLEKEKLAVVIAFLGGLCIGPIGVLLWLYYQLRHPTSTDSAQQDEVLKRLWRISTIGAAVCASLFLIPGCILLFTSGDSRGLAVGGIVLMVLGTLGATGTAALQLSSS